MKSLKGKDNRTWNYLYKLLLYTSKKRKLNVDLTLEDFIRISSENCYYCNAEPIIFNFYDAYGRKRMEKMIKYPPSDRPLYDIKKHGLDRKKNELGYNLNNIVPCCTQCNYSKRVLNHRISILGKEDCDRNTKENPQGKKKLRPIHDEHAFPVNLRSKILYYKNKV